MCTIRLLSPFCQHCKRGEECKYFQEINFDPTPTIAGLNIVVLHGKSSSEARGMLVAAAKRAVEDPKKYRFPNTSYSYERMIKDMENLIDSLGYHPETIVEVTGVELPF